MANCFRGEISAEFDGAPRALCLTLGALAELETAFGAGDLVALAERFQTGRLSSNDLVKIIGAGLRGAGEAITDADVAKLRHARGAAGFAQVAVDLVAAAFADSAAPNPRAPQRV